MVTGPACVGGVLNATPKATKRAYSASMSSTLKAVAGIPCSNNDF